VSDTPEPTLIDIVRNRYETGAYGNAHLVMARATMLSQPRGEQQPSWLRNPLGDLLSIPVVVDDAMAVGAWRLVDNGSGETIHEGSP